MISADVLAENIAQSIRRNDPESSSVAVLKYALIAVINTAIIASIVLIISILTGDFLKALMVITAFMVLKSFSGGMHLESENLCNVVTSIFILVSIYTPIDYWYNGFVLNISSAVILIVCAPNGIKRSRLDPKYYPVLKLISVLIVCSNFFIHSPALQIAFIIQSLTTTKIFQRIMSYIFKLEEEVKKT